MMNHVLLFVSQMLLSACVFILGWSALRIFGDRSYYYLSGIVGIFVLGSVHYLLDILSIDRTVFLVVTALLFFAGCLFLAKDFTFLRTQLKKDWKILVCAGSFALIGFGQLSNTPFVFDDEIYSWNYWAFNLLNDKPITFKFTGAAYPLFYPHFLAAIYEVIGSSAQLLAKSTLSIACFTISIVFLMIAKKQNATYFGFLVLYMIFFGLSLRGAFSLGYADALATAFIISGIYLLVLENKKKGIWLLSSLLITVAILTKQFALVYVLLPVLYCFIHKRFSVFTILVSLIPIAVSLLWFFTQGKGFTDNAGVIEASLAGRSFIEQIKHISQAKYFGLVYVVSLLCLLFQLINYRRSSWIALVCILVSYILWSIYGSYDIRLGMNIFFLIWMFFFIDFSKYSQRCDLWIRRLRFSKGILVCLVSFTMLYGAQQFIRWKSKMPPLLSVTDNSSQQVDYLLGRGAYDALKANGGRLFATSNYSYGAMQTAGLNVQHINLRDIQNTENFVTKMNGENTKIVISESGVLNNLKDQKLLHFYKARCGLDLIRFEKRTHPFAILPMNCAS